MSKSPTTTVDNENPVIDVENSPVAAVSGTNATGRQLTSNLKGKLYLREICFHAYIIFYRSEKEPRQI